MLMIMQRLKRKRSTLVKISKIGTESYGLKTVIE